MLNDPENVQLHTDAALQIGLERIEAHPTSANAAYSLGRTYSLLGRDDEAIAQLERAHQLKPTSKKFKKAYLRAKHNR